MTTITLNIRYDGLYRFTYNEDWQLVITKVGK